MYTTVALEQQRRSARAVNNAWSGCHSRGPGGISGQGEKGGVALPETDLVIDEGITQGRQLTKRHWRG